MFEQIDKNISKCISLTQKELDYFHSLLTHKKVKRKTILLQAGEVCTFEAYLIKGCVRVYYIDENGFEVNVLFAIEDWWISDLASFSQQKTSKLFIETIEDTELLMISYANKEKLYKKIPAFERLFRLMIQRTHETMMNRLISTIAKTAEQRYHEFVKAYPKIPQRVPQHLIAAYLGMSPEFLSKIRSKNSKK